MTVTDTMKAPWSRTRGIPDDRRPRDLDQDPAPPGTSFGVRGGGNHGAEGWVSSSSRTKVDMQKLTEETTLDLVEETRTNIRKWTYGEMKKVVADMAQYMPAIPDDMSGPSARVIIQAALPEMLHNWAIANGEVTEEPAETSLVPADPEQPMLTPSAIRSMADNSQVRDAVKPEGDRRYG